MGDLEQIAFQIISMVGTARSSYIEAIQAAKQGDYAKAEQLIKEGDEAFVEGHDAHTSLLTREASGEKNIVSLLILHAEDQLMSAEAFKTIALEFISAWTVRRRQYELSERISLGRCGRRASARGRVAGGRQGTIGR